MSDSETKRPEEDTAADESAGVGGRLRLDKDGTLAGKPKLKPVKAHRKPDAESHEFHESHEEGDDGASFGQDGVSLGEDGASLAEDEGGIAAPAERDSTSRDGAPRDRTSRTGAPRAGAPRKAALPPKRETLRPPGFSATAEEKDAFEEMVDVAEGSFLFGEGKESVTLAAFSIDKYPVTNAQYEIFGSTLAVFVVLIPSGVNSNAQATIIAKGKPRITMKTTKR